MTPTSSTGIAPFYTWALSTVGGLYAMASGRWYLLIWLPIVTLFPGTFSAAFIVLALLGAVFVSELSIPALQAEQFVPGNHVGAGLVVVVILLPGLLWTPMWMSNVLPGNQSPTELDLRAGDLEAEWLQNNSDSWFCKDRLIGFRIYLNERS